MKKRISFAFVLLLITVINISVFADYSGECEKCHGTSWHVAKVVEPTCTQQGFTIYACDGKDGTPCDNTVWSDYVPATGHTAGTPSQENVIAATCFSEGSYDKVIKCAVCEAEMQRTTVTTPKLDHTPGTPVRENVVDATCTTAGSYDEVIYCTVAGCGAQISRTAKTIDALGHDKSYTEIKAATCTESGVSQWTCTRTGCGASDYESVAALGHNFVNGVCTRCKKTAEASITGLSVSPTQLSLVKGGSGSTLIATTIPASLYTISWASDAPSVATVSASTGASITVSPVAAGNAIITASVTDPDTGKVYQSTCVVTVTETSPTPTPVPQGSYTVTYSSGAYATPQYATYTYTYTTGTNAYIDSTQYSRSGYYQDGWTTADGNATNVYPYGSVIANISSNITLYPHWTANAASSYTLTVTYNSQYGSVYYGNTLIANGSTLTIPQGTSKTLSFYPVNQYYVWNVNFAGWNKGSCSSYTVTYDSMRGASRTLSVTFASIYSSPKTGDDSNIALYAALAGVAAVGIVGVLFFNKKAGKPSSRDKRRREK